MVELALGIDVASASWANNGSALLEFDRATPTFCSVTPGALVWPGAVLTPAALADEIDRFARLRRVAAVALDGPQGWRDPATPLGARGVGRRCEYACRTQGKTGVYPRTFPGNQRPWIEFSIAVFDELLRKPGVVLANAAATARPANGYLVLECFPTSTWRASGLKPLPGKRKRPTLLPFIQALSAAYGLPPFSTNSHDDLQAVVAALTATAALGGPASPVMHGVASSSLIDTSAIVRRLEGFIWDAKPPGMRSSS